MLCYIILYITYNIYIYIYMSNAFGGLEGNEGTVLHEPWNLRFTNSKHVVEWTES